MKNSQKAFENKAVSRCHNMTISMTYQRRRATAHLLIPLHWRGGGEAGGVVSGCGLDQSFLKQGFLNCPIAC